jgi:hypothetical protein
MHDAAVELRACRGIALLQTVTAAVYVSCKPLSAAATMTTAEVSTYYAQLSACTAVAPKTVHSSSCCIQRQARYS